MKVHTKTAYGEIGCTRCNRTIEKGGTYLTWTPTKGGQRRVRCPNCAPTGRELIQSYLFDRIEDLHTRLMADVHGRKSKGAEVNADDGEGVVTLRARVRETARAIEDLIGVGGEDDDDRRHHLSFAGMGDVVTWVERLHSVADGCEWDTRQAKARAVSTALHAALNAEVPPDAHAGVRAYLDRSGLVEGSPDSVRAAVDYLVVNDLLPPDRNPDALTMEVEIDAEGLFYADHDAALDDLRTEAEAALDSFVP